MPLPAGLRENLIKGAGLFADTHAEGIRINLKNQGLHDEDVALFVQLCETTGTTGRLVSLDVEYNNITSRGFLMLAPLVCLRRLDVSQNDIADDAVEALCANHEILPKLEELNIANNGLTKIGISLLVNNYHDKVKTWGNLESLEPPQKDVF